MFEEGPIRKLLRERRKPKGSQVKTLQGPDVSITVFDNNIHFIFHGGALESDRTLPRDKAVKILDKYIITLEKDLVTLKEAKRSIS